MCVSSCVRWCGVIASSSDTLTCTGCDFEPIVAFGFNQLARFSIEQSVSSSKMFARSASLALVGLLSLHGIDLVDARVGQAGLKGPLENYRGAQATGQPSASPVSPQPTLPAVTSLPSDSPAPSLAPSSSPTVPSPTTSPSASPAPSPSLSSTPTLSNISIFTP